MMRQLCAVLMVALVASVSWTSVALAKTYDVSAAAMQSQPGERSAGQSSAVSHGTGFEAGEGFALGDIDGQNGWTVFSGNVAQIVSDINPATGAQHYRNQNEAALATGANVGAFSPDTGPSSIAPQILSVDVNVSATGGADYNVVAQAPSQALLTTQVNFSWLGDIRVVDDTGGGLAFEDTGVDYVPGVYKNLTIEMNPGANTLEYYYDGAHIYSSVAGVFGGTAMEQVVLYSDNWHAGDTGDFDNLQVTAIPEPASIALVGLGLIGLLARRRR